MMLRGRWTSRREDVLIRFDSCESCSLLPVGRWEYKRKYAESRWAYDCCKIDQAVFDRRCSFKERPSGVFFFFETAE